MQAWCARPRRFLRARRGRAAGKSRSGSSRRWGASRRAQVARRARSGRMRVRGGDDLREPAAVRRSGRSRRLPARPRGGPGAARRRPGPTWSSLPSVRELYPGSPPRSAGRQSTSPAHRHARGRVPVPAISTASRRSSPSSSLSQAVAAHTSARRTSSRSRSCAGSPATCACPSKSWHVRQSARLDGLAVVQPQRAALASESGERVCAPPGARRRGDSDVRRGGPAAERCAGSCSRRSPPKPDVLSPSTQRSSTRLTMYGTRGSLTERCAC